MEVGLLTDWTEFSHLAKILKRANGFRDDLLPTRGTGTKYMLQFTLTSVPRVRINGEKIRVTLSDCLS